MGYKGVIPSIDRRTLVTTGLVLGGAQITSPFIIKARGEEPIKIGLDNPLTGAYAALGKSEQYGCELAIAQMNAKGGILGRQVQLVSEDLTSSDTSVAVQKARKLIERDKVSFLLGNVNSAMALAMGQVAAELKTLLVDPGGHTDAITGTDCHWNVFRVCDTTEMLANAVAPALIKDGGKKWYYITPDYAYGHTLEAGLVKAAAKLGGTKVGGDLTPIGTTDFSAFLIKAQAAKPDVLIVLSGGQDAVNCLKQAVQFGLDKKLHVAGALQELENLEGLPPDARIGTWVFEWYWNQPNVPHVADFVAAIKKKTGKVPTARTWFGFVAAHTCGLVANETKSLDNVKLARALQDFKLPPEVGLASNQAFYRGGDHQLMSTMFIGTAQAKGSGGAEDLFKVTGLVKGMDAAVSVEETGCKMTWPA